MNIHQVLITAISALLLIGLTGAAAAAVVTTADGQTAYNGPHTVPGRVQAEDYDNGGANIAYSDTTATNTGGAGRLNEAVDVVSSNGVTSISWVYNNEWTEYTVQVAAGGSYTANFRVGSPAVGQKIALSVDGVAGCTVDVPNTGSYNVYSTVSAPLTLSAGTHVIRLTYLNGGQSVDWFELLGTGSTPVTTTVPTTAATQSGQTAYNGPHTVPGRVQAEDYDNGGANIAYSDTTATNTGGAGRLNEAVDVVSSNGVTSISWVYNNEWTEYTVQVAAGGSYTANFRVGSPAVGQKIALSVDGVAGCTVDVPNTGSYDVYSTVSAPLTLSAGTHVIRLTYLNGGQSVDWFELLGTGSTPVTTTVPTTAATVKPTTIPTTAATVKPTTIPTTAPTTPSATIGPSASTAQLNTYITNAYTAGNARMATMQQAHSAWAVPSRPDLVTGATNARTSGLKSDGSTDNTAALQSLLTSLPSGSRLYFPAGTYRINGPISITKPVTLVGESGTVFDCSRATGRTVFTINKAGSASSKMSGVTITGLVIEGPGIETTPEMILAYYLQNVKITYVKFHNVGVSAIDFRTCTDALVEDCVFDNVFYTGEGYGVSVIDRCDRVVVRDNFFVTKGRHGVTTGITNTAQSTSEYVQGLTVENNYFEYMTEEAVNAHTYHAGAYVVRGNVIKSSNKGIQLASGMADISDNVMVDCKSGILLWNAYVEPGQQAKVDKIVRNTMINTVYEAIYATGSNMQIQSNVAKGANRGSAFAFGRYPSTCSVSGNVVESYSRGLESTQTSGLSSTNNYLKVSTAFQSF
jgi:hypothetical protein